jgi:hypothetical protein
MADLARRVIGQVGRGRLTFKESTRQAFSLCTATDKAARLLGFRPSIGIEEIVARTLATGGGGGGQGGGGS